MRFLFFLSCRSLCCCSSVGGTHGSTCHLHADNVNLLGSDELEVFKAQVAHLDALTELQVAHVDGELLGYILVECTYVDFANESYELTTPSAKP